MIFIGHLKPDTDSVCAAIAAANLFNGQPATAGELNNETEFVLNHFNVDKPQILNSIAGKEIGIIDHNQTTQAPAGYEEADIKMIIDHHTIDSAMYTTKTPIEVIMKPWGSSCAIIANEYFEKNKDISKPMAGIMLAAILSDTLCFQSPTCTEFDKEIADKLKPIAEINDYKEFAKEMFKAKSDISTLSSKEILNLDYKEFEMGSKKIGIGVAETVEPELLLNRKAGFLTEMVAQKDTSVLDYIYFIVVDVLNTHSVGFIIDQDHATLAKNVFGGEVIEKQLDLGNRVSRKKEIVPPLKEYLEK